MNDLNKQTIDEKISETLGINPPTQIEKVNSPSSVSPSSPEDSKKDYEEVRRNLKDLISSGTDAIEGILKVAYEGDNPRAFEVAAQMLKTVSDINKDLISLHQNMKSIETPDMKVNNTTNNSIYVGSTSDLQDLINVQRSTRKAITKDIDEDDIIDM